VFDNMPDPPMSVSSPQASPLGLTISLLNSAKLSHSSVYPGGAPRTPLEERRGVVVLWVMRPCPGPDILRGLAGEYVDARGRLDAKGRQGHDGNILSTGFGRQTAPG
jgi:hypothetical protein